MDLRDLRREYARSGLSEEDLSSSPYQQFQTWFDDINRPETIDSTAMVLATVGADNQPMQRTVLLKSFDESGFVFYSHYDSKKGQDITHNPKVNLCFAWYALERQVIISGTTHKLSEQESDQYFQSRPRSSQIATWVSRQSVNVPNRTHLANTFDELSEQWKGQHIPRPPYWGGYCVVPERFEFWQGRKSRMHDRLIYTLDNTDWVINRLAP